MAIGLINSVALRTIASTTSLQAASAKTLSQAGLHPAHKRMQIIRLVGVTNPVFTNPIDSLVCHYNPETFTRSVAAEYTEGFVTGMGVQNILFKYGRPRKWNFELLFNEWGDSQVGTNNGTVSVEDSLDWLDSMMLPYSSKGKATGKWGIATVSPETNNPDAYAPPLLGIFLTSSMIMAYLTGFELVAKKIHPDTLKLARAVATVEFTQALPSNI